MKKASIKRDFGDLSYVVFPSENANAKTLLGLSGFGCSHYNYLDAAPELSKNFNLVLVDNRGTGDSSLTSTDYSLKDVAADALAVMDELNIKEFGLMGISMGGFIAQELVTLAPNRVKAIAFMCTLSTGKDFIHPNALTEEGLRQFSSFPIEMQAEFATSATVHPTLKEKRPDIYKHIVETRIRCKVGIEELVRQNKAAVNFLGTPYDLSKIICPVMAMAGADDRFVNPENVKAFQKNIKQCQIAFIPESDHYFFMEKSSEMAHELTRFFKEVL